MGSAKGKEQDRAGTGVGNVESSRAASYGQQDAFSELRPDKPCSRRSEGQPQSGLGAIGSPPCEEEVGDIGASDEQDQSRDRHEQTQARSVVRLHPVHAAGRRHEMDVLLRDVAPVALRDDFRMAVEPLLQFDREPSLCPLRRDFRSQSSDEIKPLGHGVVQQPVIRLGDQGQPEIGRIAAQRVAVELRRGHSCNRVRSAVDIDRRADHGWIEPEVLLPSVIAHHRHAGRA